MPPIRTRAQAPSRPPIEELIIYTLLIGTGVIPVSSAISAIHAGGAFGVEATIGALMMLTGIAGIAAYLWHTPAAPAPAAPAHSGDAVAGSRSR